VRALRPRIQGLAADIERAGALPDELIGEPADSPRL